jgi:uncharacterized spore protein YtfJ
MNEQSTTPEFDLEAEADASLAVVQETMDRFLEIANVEAVYAEPVEHGDTLIIPAAEVLCGMGFGAGYGFGKSEQADEPAQGGGGGGGGGGRTFSRPVAVIVVSPQGVRVEPVIDITKIGLAALTAAGFMLSVLARMSRHSSS